MATTYYVDYYNGTNYNHGASGLTWATAYKTLSGITSKVNVYSGDTIKVAKTQDVCDTGINATWSSVTGYTTDASKNINGSSNTTPIVITLSGHNYSDGDVIHILAHTSNLSANGIWLITGVTTNTFNLVDSIGMATGGAAGTATRINHKAVVLDQPLTKSIHNCDYYSSSINNWTGSGVSNGTLSTTDWKEGYSSLKIGIGTNHTANTILCKSPTPETLDLSSYSGISLKIKADFAMSKDQLSIKLYSDSGCTLEVESLNVPSYTLSANVWYSFSVNKGSALSSSIKGISIFTNTLLNMKTIYIDNIVAIKDPSNQQCISHTTLITKNPLNQINSGNTEGYYSIKSIKDRILVIDNDVSSLANAGRGYYGTTENCRLYKREPVSIGLGESNCYKTGNATTPIYIEFGYNTISNTKDGECWFDGGYTYPAQLPYYTYNSGYLGFCRGAVSLGRSYFENLSFVSMSDITNATNVGNFVINNLWNANNGGGSTFGLTRAALFNTIHNVKNNLYDVVFGLPATLNPTGGRVEINLLKNFCNNKNLVLYELQSPIKLNNFICNNGWIQSACNRDMYITNEIKYNAAFLSNGGGNVNVNGCGTATVSGNTLLFSTIFQSSIRPGMYININNFAEMQSISFDNYANDNNSYYVINDEYIYRDGYIVSDTIMKDETTFVSGSTSWKLSIRRNQGVLIKYDNYSDEIYYPLILTLGKVYVEAGKEVIISAYMKKTHESNIGGKLYLGPYQVGNSELQSYCTSTDWVKVALPAFTPTKSGIIKIQAHAWYINSTTDDIWVDNLEVTQ